jgi:hypothetical protein
VRLLEKQQKVRVKKKITIYDVNERIGYRKGLDLSHSKGGE